MNRRRTSSGPLQLRRATIAGFTLTEGVHSGGSSLPWHTHDGPTLCLVLDGSFIEESAGGALLCTPSTLKVMPAGEPHCDRFDHGDAHGLHIEADPARAAAIRPFSLLLQERVSFDGGPLAAIGRRIFREFTQMDTAAPLAIEGLLLEMLAWATREKDLRRIGSGPAWLARARDVLHDDPAAHISLGGLAREVGVHAVTLARAFRHTYGCSVGEYLRRLRIVRAARRLEESELSLAEIAVAAGFVDQSHFSNVFKRQTGFSPSAFRRWVRAR
ncbi:MAG: helix-turn-helix domain-containing protein [Gemmatimonadales bacterium]